MQRLSRKPEGLYDFKNEHDNCGVGFVAHLKGAPSHDIVIRGLKVLDHMTHRGAEGADGVTGDGAGILMQIPDQFYRSLGYDLPPKGEYATAMVFLTKDKEKADSYMKTFCEICNAEGLKTIGTRDVPVDNSCLGPISKEVEPQVKQVFVTSRYGVRLFERKIYVARKVTEHRMSEQGVGPDAFYIPSFSNKIVIYKGMLTAWQIPQYYTDLQDTNLKSAFAIVHSRFSTNTFPSWDLAQPFRMLAHNGEINTIKGNRFWMSARESLMYSDKLGEDMEKVFPVCLPGASDSGSFDNTLEFLTQAGKTLPHAIAMMVPESWNEKNPIDDELKAFYEYQATLMEPWDGPASLIFTDGRYIGGTLDRNGLRPSRYVITKDDVMVMGSEVGVEVFNPKDIVSKGRLRPGKILLLDTVEGRVIYDKEIKNELKTRNPYKEWLSKNRITLDDIQTGRSVPIELKDDYLTYLRAFGYTREEVDTLIAPMAETGQEAVSSMGSDIPFAAISNIPQRLFAYFKQLFAQVTNPAIDPIREELVMSLTGYIGSLNKNLLEELPEHCKMVKFISPVINNKSMEMIRNLQYKGFRNAVLPMHFHAQGGGNDLEEAIEAMCLEAEKAVDSGKNYLILTDRNISDQKAPIPSLLAVSAVHHHLIRKKKRMQCDLVVESGDVREVHHCALLFGYGASVINPYLALAVVAQLVKEKKIQADIETAEQHYIKAINKGVLKILSKIGTSTLRSYRGAQIFECLGLSQEVVDRYFTGTDSRIGGLGMSEIAEEALIPHRDAFCVENRKTNQLPNYGLYKYRNGGEKHAWNPETIALLQWSARTGDYGKFKEYTNSINEKRQAVPVFIRDYFEYKAGRSIPLEEVEPVSEITKRFVTGAMSFGSIATEAHEALAIAMNQLGGKSNTGEGGEDPGRFVVGADGLNRRSAIKQVASGRFGVTNYYLVNADEIQIKVAQGAKPGEGGQLPGHKVDQIIAKTRYSTPGITLISPPPHHDIYSIEDLKQLIYDLKMVNPSAEISVKLVSEVGVGTVAAGVAKALADRILISGAEGGTGASPASSIKYAGLPVELGLAETQQTLVLNNLREKVKLQTDGQLKTGRDIVIAAMLGAEEYGFATSALIVLGCVMMRKCHLNTCPVGVATQDEELKKRFKGKADYLVNYFRFLAEEVREILASMGYRSLQDLIGRTDLLSLNPEVKQGKSKYLDFSRILHQVKSDHAVSFGVPQDHGIQNVLDKALIVEAKAAIEKKRKMIINKPITNVDRAVGAMLSGEISRQCGIDGLPEDTLTCQFTGSAGQSFGAFLVQGLTFRLVGDSNDYVGKGLSGGKIIVQVPQESSFKPEENIIIGNTSLYGATGGEVYIQGVAGERFAVRNSGATAVVEGVGDHGCEYMTGGRVVVLGETGRNFAAGMSGGIAYVLNVTGDFDYYCNMGMVDLSIVDNQEDEKELQEIIARHQTYTGSEFALRVLNNWDDYLPQFIKVIPFEYKKILEEKKMLETKSKIQEITQE